MKGETNAHMDQREKKEQPLRSSHRGRPSKFTPENIRQITNLVERGKSRDEIAEIIGVTPATLQVTCSKLGISLRRPRFDTGTGALRKRKSAYGRENPGLANKLLACPRTVSQAAKQSEHKPVAEEVAVKEAEFGAPTQRSGQKKKNGDGLTTFAITMHYKGQERTSELTLTEDMIARLALEAELRGVKMAELLTQVLRAVVENDAFDATLAERGRRREHTAPPARQDSSTH